MDATESLHQQPINTSKMFGSSETIDNAMVARYKSASYVSDHSQISRFSLSSGDTDVTAAKLTFGEAVLTLSVTCIGAGVTTFPRVMADTGMLMGLVLCIAATLVCIECGRLICECCCVVESNSGHACANYEALAYIAGGKWCQMGVSVFKNGAFMGFIVVFVELVTESIASFLPLGSGGIPCASMVTIRFGFVFPIFGGLVLMTGLTQLARFGSLGVLAVAFECFGIMFGGLSHMSATEVCGADDTRGCRWYAWFPPGAIVASLGKSAAVFLFTLAVLGAVPNVRSQLEDKSQMPRVITRAFWIVAAVNCIVMTVGYIGFGENAPDNAVTGLHIHAPTISIVSAVAIIVNVIFSTPLCSFPIIALVEESGKDALRTPLTPINIAARLFFMAVLVTLTGVVPYLVDIIGIVSAVFVSCTNVFFPLVFYYSIMRQFSKPVSYSRRAVHASVFVAGAYVMAFGLQGSVQSMVAHVNSGTMID